MITIHLLSGNSMSIKTSNIKGISAENGETRIKYGKVEFSVKESFKQIMNMIKF